MGLSSWNPFLTSNFMRTGPPLGFLTLKTCLELFPILGSIRCLALLSSLERFAPCPVFLSSLTLSAYLCVRIMGGFWTQNGMGRRFLELKYDIVYMAIC